MVDNTGYIIFGFHIDEEKLLDVLGNEFEALQENYEYPAVKSDTQLSYISDPMRGIDGYFGIILHREDLDFDQDEPYEIPTDLTRQLEAIINFADSESELYSSILFSATHSSPKLLFATVKS